MVRYIIGCLVAFILIALLVIWILSGGPRRAFTGAKTSIDSALPSSAIGFKLPWQPAEIFPTLDITSALDFPGTADELSPEEKLAQLQDEYDRLSSEASQTRAYGAPSPYMGKIAIVQDASSLRADSARDEYLQIAANYSNTESVDIAGWTLESALTGTHVVIPPGASPFIANSANVLGPVTLDPGALALVSSAPSPVGVSFRENTCTGYLGQFQTFSPPLSEACPAPSDVLPLTETNLQQYGDACFDAITNISSCRFPQNLSTVSAACRSYLTTSLSYNGCVQHNQFRSGFEENMWRVYLGTSGDLWRNSHDAIRLLDASGKTVSVFVY